MGRTGTPALAYPGLGARHLCRVYFFRQDPFGTLADLGFAGFLAHAQPVHVASHLHHPGLVTYLAEQTVCLAAMGATSRVSLVHTAPERDHPASLLAGALEAGPGAGT